jgi:hypothetical protein
MVDPSEVYLVVTHPPRSQQGSKVLIRYNLPLSLGKIGYITGPLGLSKLEGQIRLHHSIIALRRLDATSLLSTKSMTAIFQFFYKKITNGCTQTFNIWLYKEVEAPSKGNKNSDFSRI